MRNTWGRRLSLPREFSSGRRDACPTISRRAHPGGSRFGAPHDRLAHAYSIAATLAADLPPNAATSTKGMVASVHPLATDAGVAALRSGGNAVDAAIAVGLTLGVVDPHNSGLGGGCFILIRRADGKLVAIDGRETAPAKATRDMYLRDGKPQPESEPDGPARRRHARRSGRLRSGARSSTASCKLADLLLPAAEIAERRLSARQAERLGPGQQRREAAQVQRRHASRCSRPTARPTPKAKCSSSPTWPAPIAASPSKAPTGSIAARSPQPSASGWPSTAASSSAEDFAAYQPIVREPLVTTYRGRTIVGFPPPSSRRRPRRADSEHPRKLRSRSDPRAATPASITHLLAEAMKLAFADRAYWLGDPDFARVPRGLIDKDYAKPLAAKIDLAKATPVAGHGTPPAADERVFAKHTTHIAAADAEGNWVAMTQTVNTAFGSLVIVPGTGVVLNNEMDDFAIAPGTPNAFGLVGAEANAVAPGKRPLSSMSPTIVLEDGQPMLTVGAAGGPTIITQVVQALVRRSTSACRSTRRLAQPRIHHQWSPDAVRIESRLDAAVAKVADRRGHKLTVTTATWAYARRSSSTRPAASSSACTTRACRAKRRGRAGQRGEKERRREGERHGDDTSLSVSPSLCLSFCCILRRQCDAQPTRRRSARPLAAGNADAERRHAVPRPGSVAERHGDRLRRDRPAARQADVCRHPRHPARGVAKVERLDAAEHAELAQRLRRFRNRAVIEAGRMDAGRARRRAGCGEQATLRYRGPWFTLTSTADDERTRRCVVRIEQIFRAYRTLLPPRIERPAAAVR